MAFRLCAGALVCLRGKRAGEAGKALRAGGGADFIFSASERVVMAFRLFAGALVCMRAVLCGGERVRA
ncbi:hypothetical protein [Escherichia coli]|uniref:hypothetical protein n=1 Tax=Escherichia coli TaxID=562 RepID=UPI000CF0FCD0|nr:hypothetical protein C5O87_22350 [Escherichia coli]